MVANHHIRFVVPDRSYASLTKRDITRLAESYGLSANEVGKVNIVVAELLSNLTKFSPQGGELLVKQLRNPAPEGIEIICLDSGPGMADPLRMQEDGVSTFGTAGEGLGAIKRQSDLFDIYSSPAVGTVILCQIYKGSVNKPSGKPVDRFAVGAVMVPKPNETNCGDGYTISFQDQLIRLLALDGLGHGSHASEASSLAIQAFEDFPVLTPADALRHIHSSIKRSRGAVGLITNISLANQRISYCGIGNIAGKLYSVEPTQLSMPYKNIISYNGILGHNIPTTLNNQQLDWNRNKILVIHSDGLRSRWDLGKYVGLHRHHATTIAAVLYKDHGRHTDDTLVLVCKAKV
ncbi:MAG: SpoIIE family protein phosphatase [Hymenobacteraceae bacterium]|nr:SpoIIE family protein phosphatase [Hymenobacteraceae bacterium]MDX5423130.1 SpoIIE family protein phosphatase [Hymenobacteraceae bacterium]